MDRVLKVVGVLAILLITLFGGYYLGYETGYTDGVTPTADEAKDAKQREQAINDIYSVSTKYEEVYNICEDKYQHALNGDLDQALIYKGKQDQLETEIDKILNKYSQNNTGTKDLYVQ